MHQIDFNLHFHFFRKGETQFLFVSRKKLIVLKYKYMPMIHNRKGKVETKKCMNLVYFHVWNNII